MPTKISAAAPAKTPGGQEGDRMKAVICNKPGTLSLTDYQDPVPGPGEALVKVERIGVCGTDLHIYEGMQPFVEYPRIMGHELSATIARSPENGVHQAGTPVVVNPYIPCGQCIACRKGKPNCCVHINVLGVHRHGGMCEFLALPESALIPARSLTLDQAAMVECLAIGAHAVRRGETRPMDKVLIAGLGPIGLGAALFARLSGAEVTVMDKNPARLDKAKNIFGFGNAVVVSENTAEALAGLTAGDFYDVVFDATGSRKAIEEGFSYVAHGGSYVLISVVKGDITFSDAEFHKREMRLIGSRNATMEDFNHVIRQIEAGNIPTDDLHTHSCRLDELPEELGKWIANPDDVIKAIAKVE